MAEEYKCYILDPCPFVRMKQDDWIEVCGENGALQAKLKAAEDRARELEGALGECVDEIYNQYNSNDELIAKIKALLEGE